MATKKGNKDGLQIDQIETTSLACQEYAQLRVEYIHSHSLGLGGVKGQVGGLSNNNK